jgi:hypothetical protein
MEAEKLGDTIQVQPTERQDLAPLVAGLKVDKGNNNKNNQ